MQANLPLSWLEDRNDVNTQPFRFRMRIRNNGRVLQKDFNIESPFRHIYKTARKATTECFDLLHEEAWPGKRVIDVFAD